MTVVGLERSRRRGGVTILTALMLVVMMGMVAFSVDLGYVAVTRNELQNAADSACLAGASQLLSKEAQLALWSARNNNTLQKLYYEGVNSARLEAQKFGQRHKGGGESLVVQLNLGNDSEGDIVLGYIDRKNPKAPMRFDVFPYNSVQVRTWRNEDHSGQLNLFFARVLGRGATDVTALATATITNDPFAVIPITLHIDDYRRLIDKNQDPGESDDFTFNPNLQPNSDTDFTNRVTAGSSDDIREFRLYPDKGKAPGNFGTLDMGHPSGSTPDIRRQIQEGLSPGDVSLMDQQGLLTNGRLVATEAAPMLLSGDTGISWTIETDLSEIIGQARTIPLYNRVHKQGTIAQYTIVGFVNVTIVQALRTGSDGKSIYIQPIAPFKILESPDDNLLGSLTLTR